MARIDGDMGLRKVCSWENNTVAFQDVLGGRLEVVTCRSISMEKLRAEKDEMKITRRDEMKTLSKLQSDFPMHFCLPGTLKGSRLAMSLLQLPRSSMLYCQCGILLGSVTNTPQPLLR